MPILQVANVHHDAAGHTRTQISTANTVTWYTSNSEKLRLDSSGNLSVGRSDTTYKLDVVGSANASQYYINDTLITLIANTYAQAVGAGANSGTGTAANIYAQAVGVGANSGTGTAANLYAQSVGAGANSGTGTAANLYSHNIGVLANNRANAIGVGANTWSNTVFGYANNKFLSNTLTTYTYTGSLNVSSILVNGVAVSSSGSGDFNTNILNSLGAALTSSLADTFTAPVTAGKRYIIRSIHITNIGSTNAYVTGDLQGTTYGSVTFASLIPVPIGTSIELLKKPKIMQPSDILRLKADIDSTLHATIAYEIATSTSHFGAGVDITSGATYTDLYTATGNAVLESLLLTNDDGSYDVKARVVWTNGLNAIQGYYCYDIIVPSNASVELLEMPKNLPSGYKVRVYAGQANRLEAIIAGKVA